MKVLQKIKFIPLIALIGFMSLMSSQSLLAYPTDRPLPNRVVDDSPEAVVLRDHEDRDRFYVLPKNYQIETKTNFKGNDQVSCQLVEDFHKTESLLTETRRRLAEVQRDRTALLQQLIANQTKFELQRTELVARKLELEKAIEDSSQPDSPANQQLIDELKRKLESVNTRLKAVEGELTRYTTLMQTVESEFNQVLQGLSKVETDEKKYQEKVARPVATLDANLKLSPIFKDPNALAKSIGLAPERIQFPNIIALELSPSKKTGDDGSVGEKDALETSIGFFTPSWSETSFKYNETDLGGSVPSVTLQQRSLPDTITFQQILSLYTFCNYKNAENEIRLPLQVRYSIMMWSDSDPIPYLRSEILSHRFQVADAIWKKIAELPVHPLDELLLRLEDRGDPNLFSNKGNLKSKTVSMVLNSVKQQPNNKGEPK